MPVPAQTLADEIEASLWRDVVVPWFPACVNPAGGFFQNFSDNWRRQEPTGEFCVFQSRMTWLTSALASGRERSSAEFRALAIHGARTLIDRFLNCETGAVAWTLDAQGRSKGDLHAYGSSFAIYALAAAHRATGIAEFLDAALMVFQWLEVVAHDPNDGGYFECFDREGQPILETPKGQISGNGDAIGTPYGLKSQNTHLHLLEAFTELARAGGNPLVLARLAELIDILSARLMRPDGSMYGLAQPNWTPVPTEISFGHDVEAAHLLVSASVALNGNPQLAILEAAQRLVDRSLLGGLDRAHGGFFGTEFQGRVDRTKIWWVQAEALLGLVSAVELFGERYRDPLDATWGWIRDHQIDALNHGWIPTLTEVGSTQGTRSKGQAWKAAYHDGRALLYSADILRRIAP